MDWGGGSSFYDAKLVFELYQRKTPNPGEEYQLQGRIQLINKQTKKTTDGAIRATITLSGTYIHNVEGRIQYVINGKSATFPVTGSYVDGWGKFQLQAQSGTFGSLDMIALPYIDISGTWDFIDDPAGNMRIAKDRYAFSFTGKYRGTGAHRHLDGWLSGGVFHAESSYDWERDKDYWEGTFNIHELGNVVGGEFRCVIVTDIDPMRMDCSYNQGAATFTLSKIK